MRECGGGRADKSAATTTRSPPARTTGCGASEVEWRASDENGSIADDAAALAARLENAWNDGDGAGFAAAFADDADFVNVLGMHARGREAIGHGHAEIFRTIYAGSTVRYRLAAARLLRPDVGLAHVQATLTVPAGPMAGTHPALYSMVLVREGGGEWRIASFHNTFVRDPATLGR